MATGAPPLAPRLAPTRGSLLGPTLLICQGRPIAPRQYRNAFFEVQTVGRRALPRALVPLAAPPRLLEVWLGSKLKFDTVNSRVGSRRES